VIASIMRRVGETGVQSHVNSFASFLEKEAVRAEVLTPFEAPPALLYPVFAGRRLVRPMSGEAAVWWYRHWHGVFLRAALRKVLGAARQCVIYAQCPVSAAAALAARRTPQQRVVMAVHFNLSQADEWAEKGEIRRGGGLYRRIQCFEERVLPSLDGLVYVSQFMRREVELRIPAVRMVPAVVIPNFVHPCARYDAAPCGDLITIGSLEPRKNHIHILRVLSVARERGYRYTLTIVGDGPEWASLRGEAARLGISEQVRFLGWVRDARNLIPKHRVYCHAARMENLSVVLLEAMACGRPILAAPVGGLSEAFDDGIEGIYWDLEDPLAASGKMIELLENGDLYVDMAGAALRRFQRQFDVAVAGSRLASFLCRLEQEQPAP
jgi:glycosyltransferase involved in cell wall biosynthesis